MSKVPEFSKAAKELNKGIYEHYKGNRYKVLGVGRDEETLAETVVYQALYGERDIWIRPIANFTEVIQVKGDLTPRFRYIG